MAFKRAANQKLVEVALAALGWLLVPSCSLDNRDPRLAFSDAGVSRGGTVDGEDVEFQIHRRRKSATQGIVSRSKAVRSVRNVQAAS